jgi:RNA polymerase sigma factor (TIGR02999 family)
MTENASGEGELTSCRTTASKNPSPTGEITQVLQSCRDGDQDAFQKLISMVYNDLRRIAHRQLERDRPGQTLNTTGLVHEVYLKLVSQSKIEFKDRAHFFAASARAMRHIIVDYAKRQGARKRGGNTPHVGLDDAQLAIERQAEMLLTLDQALAELASLDVRLIRVVECRFFAGYTEEETAEALTVSTRTVQRDWLRAKAWLKEEIGRQPIATQELDHTLGWSPGRSAQGRG